MKLTVLGGGGVRSPLLAKSLAISAKRVGIKDLVFMDIDENKLKLIGNISKNVVKHIDSSLSFATTTSIDEAVEGADYIITTIRVAGDRGRVLDEKIALAQNILGQETTGPGGFAMAMRSVPVLLNYANLIAKKANPKAITFNFTNPAALVAQALTYAGVERNIGICDGPAGQIKSIKNLLKLDANTTLSAECYGLNHLSWFKNFTANGVNLDKHVFSHPKFYELVDKFSPALIKSFGNSVPNGYLHYFYYREQALAKILQAKTTRGEDILDINFRMLKALKLVYEESNESKSFQIFINHLNEREKAYGKSHESPDDDSFEAFLANPDDGGYAGVALEYIRIINSGKPQSMILNTANINKAIDFLETDDVIESDCLVTMDGLVTPRMHTQISDLSKSLILSVKAYERCAARAILSRSKDLAKEALTMHPLVMSYSLSDRLVDDYLLAHKEYIGF